MKRTIILFAFCILSVSCVKQVLLTSGKVIFETELDSAAGSLDVLISTEGVWNASSLSFWIKVDESLHKDNYVITLDYESNRSIEGDVRNDRCGKVVVRSYDGGQTDTLIINQRGMRR